MDQQNAGRKCGARGSHTEDPGNRALALAGAPANLGRMTGVSVRIVAWPISVSRKRCAETHNSAVRPKPQRAVRVPKWPRSLCPPMIHGRLGPAFRMLTLSITIKTILIQDTRLRYYSVQYMNIILNIIFLGSWGFGGSSRGYGTRALACLYISVVVLYYCSSQSLLMLESYHNFKHVNRNTCRSPSPSLRTATCSSGEAACIIHCGSYRRYQKGERRFVSHNALKQSYPSHGESSVRYSGSKRPTSHVM